MSGALRRWLFVGVLALGGVSLAATARADETAERAAAEAGTHPGGEVPEEGTPEIHGKSLAFQLVNFSVLVGILVWFGGPAINKALAARHQQLKADLAAASAARAEAEARLAKQEARLAALEQEIEGIRQGVRAEAEAEKERLIAAAEERARRIKDETSFALEQQTKEAEARLRREVALASVELAEQLVRKSLGPAACPII